MTPDGKNNLAEIEAADRANQRWRPSNKSDRPRDSFDRKLYQAEMLAVSLYGEGFEGFSNMHDRIQEGVLWLLSDLITEAREALEESEKKGAKS